MKEKTKILTITDDVSGDAIRSYIIGIMKDLQNLRSSVDNLKNYTIIFELFEYELNESNAKICALNSLMGNIIGYTVSDDIWEKQPVSL